jgi:hypothetical protein
MVPTDAIQQICRKRSITAIRVCSNSNVLVIFHSGLHPVALGYALTKHTIRTYILMQVSTSKHQRQLTFQREKVYKYTNMLQRIRYSLSSIELICSRGHWRSIPAARRSRTQFTTPTRIPSSTPGSTPGSRWPPKSFIPIPTIVSAPTPVLRDQFIPTHGARALYLDPRLDALDVETVLAWECQCFLRLGRDVFRGFGCGGRGIRFRRDECESFLADRAVIVFERV